MELVRAQARGLLEAASTSSSTEEKKEKISQLVEIATFRADSALVEEIVTSVCDNVSDRTKAVRRSVLDFVEAVCLSDKATELCATKGLEAAAFLAAGEGSSALAVKALRCSSRMLGLGRFARRKQPSGDGEIDCLDSISRERLVGALKEEGDEKFGAAAAECCLAVLLRDADFDSRGFSSSGGEKTSKKPKVSEKTKNVATAMASAIAELSGERRARALDAAAAALTTAFGLVHKVLVAAVIAALESDADTAAVRCAVSALHSAETARRHQTSQGVLAAASARLEAALRRAGCNDATDEALEAARNGQPLGSVNKKRIFSALSESNEAREKAAAIGNASPESVVFALAREDRLAMILEALDEEEMPPLPSMLEEDASSTEMLTLEKFLKAVDSAVTAALEPTPDRKRRARDPRRRRERPKQQLVQIVDDAEDDTAMADAKEPAVEEDARLLEDTLDEDEEVSAEQAGTLTSDSIVLGLELSEKQEQFMRKIALERLAEARLNEPSLRDARDALLARLARHELEQKSLDPNGLRQLWDDVNFDDATAASREDAVATKTADEWKAINAARCDAALKVLFESYATRDLHTYDALIVAIIPSLIHSLAKGGVNERTLFTETLCAVPRLTEGAVKVLVDSSCLEHDEDEEGEASSKKKVSLGLSALQFIALGRPQSRRICCRAVLELTRRPDVSAFVRYQAVRVAANLLFPVVAVQPYIRNFAVLNATTKLTRSEAPPEEKVEEEQEQQLTVDDAARELALLLAVSIKDLQLVRTLYDVVADAKDDTVRQALEAEFTRLNIATLFAANHGCQQVLSILAAKEKRTPAYDALVVRLVELFGDIPLARRGKGLWAGVEKLVEACRDDDDAAVKFFAPALNDANAEQFQSALPRLLKALDDEQVAKALKGAAAAADANNNNNKVAKDNVLDAAQVLVALHRVQGGVSLKRVTKVLSVCLAARETFGAVTLRDVSDTLLPSVIINPRRLSIGCSPFHRATTRKTM